jgi:hypothetical protein
VVKARVWGELTALWRIACHHGIFVVESLFNQADVKGVEGARID